MAMLKELYAILDGIHKVGLPVSKIVRLGVRRLQYSQSRSASAYWMYVATAGWRLVHLFQYGQ